MGIGVTYSVFHLEGYFPVLIALQKIIKAGLARKGRNSVRKVIGKSFGTEAVFFEAVRIL